MQRKSALKVERLILLGIAALLGLFVLAYIAIERSEDFSLEYVTNPVLLSALGICIALLILTLLFVLFRNLIKVLVERKRGILGSQFQTKLVFTFFALWLLPSGMIFALALNLIQVSIARWFSTPVDQITEDSQRLVDVYYDDYRERARDFAEEVSQQLTDGRYLDADRWNELPSALESYLQEYHLGLISVYLTGEEPITVADVLVPAEELERVTPELLARAQSGEDFQQTVRMREGVVIRGGFPIYSTFNRDVVGAVVCGYHVPGTLAGYSTRIARATRDYRQSKVQKGSIQRVYLSGFAFVTLLILFAVTWIGLYLSRRVTVPIQALAEGTQAVRSGDLDHQVGIEAGDELGQLVDSFNEMTRQLRENQKTIESANQDLWASNRELVEQRRTIETLLDNVTSGVVNLDSQGRVRTLNRTAQKILRLERSGAAVGSPCRDVLAGDERRPLLELLEPLIGRPDVSLARDLLLTFGHQKVSLAVTVTSLGEDTNAGTLVVLEDYTELARAQRVAAWRDVARRLAHEIKNPLTPIQLSAQRVARAFRLQTPGLERLVQECTGTIAEEAQALKEMVDEFSRFARLPPVRPTAGDPHAVIEAALGLFSAAPDGIEIVRELRAPDLEIPIDREQMKRALINVVDNAIEAMQGSGRVVVSTEYLSSHQLLRIDVADDGPGVPSRDRDKLFEPYFSTKGRGTGLGLAIVYRIVQDHHGHIRVEDNRPRGARFIIELPA